MNKEKDGGLHASILIQQVIRNAICIFLCILSLIPFWIMIVNATRTSVDIQSSFSLIPSHYLAENWQKLLYQASQNVPLWRYMVNSLVIAGGSTILAVYFSTMTAYGVTAYKFRGANFAWAFIMAIMMIPVQVSSIGFFRFMYQIGWGNNYLPLIIPAIAAPATVFFMRQYMISALPLEILDSARIDGSGEFRTFNTIAMPLMKPAVATQCIFAFIGSWNNFYTPSMLLTSQKKYTLPMLSKYIIAGVALGGVKE